MKKRVFFFILCLGVSQLFSQQKEVVVNGVVTHQDEPIANVTILVKGTSNGVRTDREGKYAIQTKPKDVLIFSYVGMQTLEIALEEGMSTLNAQLVPKVEALDEVVVKKKRAFTQKELLAEYPFNKGLIKTSRGIIDKDIASFSIRIIDGKDLIPVGTDFLYSLQNLYPQMKVIRDTGLEPRYINPKVYLQNWSSGASPTALFDVDGFIYEQPPTFIPINDIERVAILVRNGAISRYGSQGAGGVIIINTKSQAWMDDMGLERTYDNTDLRDSLIRAMNRKETFTPSIPSYMEEFTALTSEQQAQQFFERLESKYGNSPYYYLEVSDYFRTQWKSPKKAVELLRVLENKFPNDVAALKAAAYAYDELGRSENALAVYLKILKLRSRDAQSRRDVANAYMELDNFRTALSGYARYELAINELDTIAFDPYGTDVLMTTESSNIIKLKRKELSMDKNTIDGTLENPSTRLLFEWNQKDAEFELQIVTPDGGYDTWGNTVKSKDILLLNHKIKGYTSKQFFMDDALKGAWKVNLNYFGTKTKAPTYLKLSVYFDYGSPSQRKESRLFKLTEQFLDKQLLQLNTDTELISK